MSREGRHSGRKQYMEDQDQRLDDDAAEEMSEADQETYGEPTDSEPAGAKAGMNREMKVGIAVIAVLAIAVGILLVKRFAGSPEIAGVDAEQANTEEAPKTVFKKRERASDGATATTGSSAPVRRSRTLATGNTSRYATAEQTTPDRYSYRTKSAATTEQPSVDPFRQGRASATPSGADRYASSKAAGLRYSQPASQVADENPLRRSTTQTAANGGQSSRYSDAASSGFQVAEQEPLDQVSEPVADDSDIPDYSADVAGDVSDSESSNGRYDYAGRYRSSSSDTTAADTGFYESEQVEAPVSNKTRAPSFDSKFAASPAADDNTYLVQNDESFWEIAQKQYGNGAYYKALEAYNAHRFPNSGTLQSGDLVETPTLAELEHAYPDLCPKLQKAPTRRRVATAVKPRRAAASGRVYVVQEGDTVFDIARYELGQATRWAEIYELNRDVLGDDLTHLPPGSELRLPSQERGRVVQRPGSRFR